MEALITTIGIISCYALIILLFGSDDNGFGVAIALILLIAFTCYLYKHYMFAFTIIFN